MFLKSAAFRGNQRLERAADNNPSMRSGERGHAVALVQGALVSLKYALPKSTTKKHGAPDGIFGQETTASIIRFQRDHKLNPDGAAGRRTISCMDDLLPSAPAPKAPEPQPPPPAPLSVVPTSSDFKLGTDDPKIMPDAGAGPWNSKPKEILTAAKYVGITQVLGPAYVVIGDDAVKHMSHYLGNSGATLTIDLAGMIAEVTSAKALFDLQVARIRGFSEGFSEGIYDITSTHVTNGYNGKNENRNWFFAVGGYSNWTKGHLKVTGTGASRQLTSGARI